MPLNGFSLSSTRPRFNASGSSCNSRSMICTSIIAADAALPRHPQWLQLIVQVENGFKAQVRRNDRFCKPSRLFCRRCNDARQFAKQRLYAYRRAKGIIHPRFGAIVETRRLGYLPFVVSSLPNIARFAFSNHLSQDVTKTARPQVENECMRTFQQDRPQYHLCCLAVAPLFLPVLT